MRQGPAVRMVTTENGDFLDRLQGMRTTPSGSTMPAMGKRGYDHSAAQQRKRQTLEDGSCRACYS
jgi:hypothetical protein